MAIKWVPPDKISTVFPALQPRLAHVLDKLGGFEHSLESIYEDLVEGVTQLWLMRETHAGGDVGESGIALTRIVAYPNRRRLRIILVEGQTLKQWLAQMEFAKDWARDFGVSEIEAWVRPGMRKKLCQEGWDLKYEVVVKPVETLH